MFRKWRFRALGVLCVVLVMALVPGMVLAAEAPAPTVAEGSPWWAQLVYVIVTALVGTLAVPFLARKAQAAKAEVEKLRAEGLANGVQARHILVADLKHFFVDYCGNVLEERLPLLLPKILKRQMDSAAIKKELRGWGSDARRAAINYFEKQGLDIVGLVGDAYLDQALRWAADRVSPFPGKETAVTLAQEKYTNWLVEKGVDYVREQFAKGGTPEASAPMADPVE